MEPIVNPWFFYWLGVLDGINPAIRFFSVLGIFFIIISQFIKFFNTEAYTRKEELIKYRTVYKYVDRICIFLFLLSILSHFIPTSSTLIKMFIAKQVTPDNINIALDLIEKAFTKSVQIIKEVR